MSDSSEANGSGPSYPTSFGRGWIPADRDIGLPDDPPVLAAGQATARAARAGEGQAAAGATGGAQGACPAGEPARRDPFSAQTLHEMKHANHNSWTPARKAAFLHHLVGAWGRGEQPAGGGGAGGALAPVGLCRAAAGSRVRCRVAGGAGAGARGGRGGARHARARRGRGGGVVPGRAGRHAPPP